MAPTRKKKKPASNPARGFATTSIASKPKEVHVTEESETTVPIQDKKPGEEDPVLSASAAVDSTSKELHELSPEELEIQLEESDLQLLVEKHGEKSKKDASRQIARLQAERRVLRTQAEPLSTHRWLPPELMLQITDQLLAQMPWVGLYVESDNKVKPQSIPEDDLSVRLWSLKQVLMKLGFLEAKVQEAISQLLQNDQLAKHATFAQAKDFIWGLEECLDWLGLVCEPGEMPDYEASRPGGHLRQSRGAGFSGLTPDAGTPHTTPEASGSSTPSTETLTAPQEHASDVGNPNTETLSNTTSSDSESDLEADELVTKYVSIMTRVHLLRPDLTQMEVRRDRRGKQASQTHQNRRKISDPEIGRLFTKLNRIESDILFDQDEAYQQWTEARITLVKEAAERRRLHLDRDNATTNNADAQTSMANLKGLEQSDTEDTSTILGDLFSSLPDTRTDSATGVTTMVDESSNAVPTVIRDFGKWNGVSPRRTFEEACKARDSGCKITFKLVSSSTFSNRHAVTIDWSRDQDLPTPAPITSISCEGSSRSVTVTMMSISTPSALQSEAYAATTALFVVFSSVPKEEKAYLRLPPAWRNLWSELSEARKEQQNAADRDALRELRGFVRQHNSLRETNSSDVTNGHGKSHSFIANGELAEKSQPEAEAAPGASAALAAMWHSKASAPAYQHMLMSRTALPIWSFKQELLDAIESNQVVIVCGETGCGKSTQVPAFILESELSNGRACKVYCTEPRRISAISLARRVSEELGERKGDVGTSRSLVGYAIRLESRTTSQTRLVYATTGIVMRMLERSDDLGDITHIVLDEVHERTIDSDFLLIILRKLMVRRQELKVVLMSATIDAQRFSTYLNGAPIFNVPGRTFPVEIKFLEDAVEASNYNNDHGSSSGASRAEDDDDDDERPQTESNTSDMTDTLRGYSARTRSTLAQFDEYGIDYDLMVKLLETVANNRTYASYSKAILVFLPGIAEIRRLNSMLIGHPAFSHAWYVYPLHSTIATEEQEQAFLVPPAGTRKIVLATNIAETGITIPDVTCVIDTGKHKEMRFDERRQLSRLIESFISRANAKQRRGRAGRVQNGLCFHMFTRARHDQMMAEQQTPEMLRLSLQDLVLRVKICQLGEIEQTLSEALDPPSAKNIRRAIDSLVDVKALTVAESLTPLGRQLAKLPLDVFLGKLILLGAIFNCLDAALTIAAILSSKSPFSAPMGSRSQADLARLAFKKGDSDLLTVYNAYCAWRRVCGSNGASEYQFCRKNFLSPQTLSNIEDVKAQLTTSLVDTGIVRLNDAEQASLNRARFYSRQRHFVELPETYNTNNDSDSIVDSVVAWSFYPKILARDGKGWRNVANSQSVSLHPSSVNKGVQPPRYLSFYHIMQSNNKSYNAHETSVVEDFAIALICGDADFKIYSGVIIIDGNRLRYSVSNWKTMVAIKFLRLHLRDVISQAFRNPGKPLSSQQQVWFDIWQQIFTREKNDKF